MKCPSMIQRQSFILAILLLGSLFFLGCETLDSGGSTGGSLPKANDAGSIGIVERFQVGELIKVEFSGTPDQIQPHEEHIKDDGTITLQLIGAIRAAGKTPGELQKDIQKAYVPRYYRNLNVTVKGSERFYFVGGEVKQPGRQLYLGPITLTGAIKSAGDFTDFAKKRQVELKRSNGEVQFVNAEKALRDKGSDPAVYPGDSITVPRSWY